MKNRLSAEERLASLRNQAEARIAGEHINQDNVVHDLQVHQIELEMQNEELRKAQEQLSEMVEKYSDLYDFSPVGYVTTNKSGLIVELNLTCAGQFKRERARLLRTPLRLNIATEDRRRMQTHLDQVFAGDEERQTCELRLAKKSGPESYVQLDSIRVVDGDDTVFCRTSVTDISLRKDIEKELVSVHNDLERRVQERTAELFVGERQYRRLSQEFQALLNAITDTLILFSPKMEVLWTNSEDSVHLDATNSEAVEKYCSTLIHDPAPLSLDCPITRCFKSGQKEFAFAGQDGSLLDLRAFPVKEADTVNSVLLLVSDITEKIATQAEAMQAGHMASLGELASGVAHEINNPITGIINYGQILVNEGRPGSLEMDIGGRIVKEGDRIGRIVKTLLSYARDGREEKTPTHVKTILEESIILTQAQIRKEGILLHIDLAEDLPEIHANLQQIQQSFINVINNARYALNEKYPNRHENKRLEITGKKIVCDGRAYVRIVFHDQGVGIAADNLPMLAKQFFSTKPFGKGTGLGLNITQKIIADHGGQLSFSSNQGEFTTVTIDLPVEPAIERDDL